MAGPHDGAVRQQVRLLYEGGSVSGLTDWQLLRRYASRRDESAFAALVARHGSMVLGVCRRVLHSPEDVDDAFQATFLVLARKAPVLRERGALGAWVYHVARRVATRARADTARRRARERPADPADVIELAVHRHGPEPDLGPLLDAELGRLPESYRAAVVLCDLEGLTHDQAARELGWPIGTVKGRLARARERLRGRLTRRGLTLSVAMLVATCERSATAAVSESAAKAALQAGTGELAGRAAVSAVASALAEGAVWSMNMNTLTKFAATAAVLGAVATGSGALAWQGEGGSGKGEQRQTANSAAPAAKAAPATDVATEPQDTAKSPPRGTADAAAGSVDPLDRSLSDLVEQIDKARNRYFDVKRLVRNPSDPSFTRTKAQLEALIEEFRERSSRLVERASPQSSESSAAERIARYGKRVDAIVAKSSPAQPSVDQSAPAQSAAESLARAFSDSSANKGGSETRNEPATPNPASDPNSNAPAPFDPLAVARAAYRLAIREFQDGKIDATTVEAWSQRLAQSEADAARNDPVARAKSAEMHVKRMTDLEQLAKAKHQSRPSSTSPLDWLAARYGLARAQRGERADATGDNRGSGALPNNNKPLELTIPGDAGLTPGSRLDLFRANVLALDAGGGTGPGTLPGQDKASLAVLKTLDEPVAMQFVNETPLEDVLKYIKETTKSKGFPDGLPIYVDPVGLQEAEKTMTSPVQIDLNGVPLRRTLQLALRQLGLIYHVEDGMIYITSESSEHIPLPPPMGGPGPILRLQDRAERGEMNAQERKAFIEMLEDLKKIDELMHNRHYVDPKKAMQ
jgi:RNA polymerase sigma factor (sigma-70 family)